jgi:hypothetical protein
LLIATSAVRLSHVTWPRLLKRARSVVLQFR